MLWRSSNKKSFYSDVQATVHGFLTFLSHGPLGQSDDAYRLHQRVTFWNKGNKLYWNTVIKIWGGEAYLCVCVWARERLCNTGHYLHTGTTDNLRGLFSTNNHNNAQEQLIFLRIQCLFVYLDKSILLKHYSSLEIIPLLLKNLKMAKSNNNYLSISWNGSNRQEKTSMKRFTEKLSILSNISSTAIKCQNG
jgi:hypothetical protein